MPTEQSDLLLDGPWQHRDLTANGVRLHVAEAGDGPLVVLLHGFPQFWWSWRHQIPALAEAGYRVVAADLRGFGSSDKPPRPYDLMTVSADIAGLIRTLGATDAAIVGHDIGGLIGWTTAVLHPDVVRGLVPVSAPHPRRLRKELVVTGTQRSRLGHIFAAQVPRLPEARLLRDDAAEVARLLESWAGRRWAESGDFAAAVPMYRYAMQVPQASYGASEYFRWMVRSLIRPDGRRFVTALRPRIGVPVLQIHGADDPYLLAATAEGSQAYTSGRYEWHLLAGIGHFPAEEAPDVVTGLLTGWLPTLD